MDDAAYASPGQKLHSEAHNLEHAIFPFEAENALMKNWGIPKTCPHGKPRFRDRKDAVVSNWDPAYKHSFRQKDGIVPAPGSNKNWPKKSKFQN